MENSSEPTKPNYNKTELEEIITNLEEIDIRKYHFTYHLKSLAEYLEEHFPVIPVGLVDIPKGTKLYRGRIHEGGLSYQKVIDYSYVPHDDKASCNEYGRANYPKHSLFYASDNPNTAQVECISKESDRSIWPYTYGVWEVQENIVMANILPNSNDERVIAAFMKPKEHLYNILKKDIDDYQCDCVKIILDFFEKQFSKSNIKSHFEYFYSVYLAERLLRLNENGKKIDGIKYSSVPMNYQGYNVALNFESIDSGKMRLLKTFEVITVFSKGVLSPRLINESVKIENGAIYWKNRIIHSKKDSFIPADKFKRLPTTDPNSNIWTIDK